MQKYLKLFSSTTLLQNYSDSLKDWCVLNGMVLNTIKCKPITFLNKSNLI